MKSFLNYAFDEDGRFELYPSFLEDTDQLSESIFRNSAFHQNQIKIYGKVFDVPRLEAWHGSVTYSYSGIKLFPQPWYESLESLRASISSLARTEFNSCLVNYYQDGSHYINYHSDDEPELGPNPTIASVSLGVSRKFNIRKKLDPQRKMSFILNDGDVLIMSGSFQSHWEHSLSKSKIILSPRINLTFRKIYESA